MATQIHPEQGALDKSLASSSHFVEGGAKDSEPTSIMTMSSRPSMVKKIQDTTSLVIEFYTILASARGTPASEPVCDVSLADTTGRDLTTLVGALNYFTDFEEDALRFQVFGCNRHKWEYKIGPEVKSWLNERLPVWLDDKPEWFDDLAMSQIPDDFVTDPAILVRLRTKNVNAIIEERRRSSVLGILTPGAAVHDEVVNLGGAVEQQEAKE
ncbi:hypothetical protein TrRE_jg3880 [Triparma retinervis]|uniref:Uncharacterized protein n=1 Tax=Triparma retinervis TaxID=2557542 RepID=A0A9W7EC56_9STRA|nr:hypothetical protein TrRE_jg3880 [Triparma retinervis]